MIDFHLSLRKDNWEKFQLMMGLIRMKMVEKAAIEGTVCNILPPSGQSLDCNHHLLNLPLLTCLLNYSGLHTPPHFFYSFEEASSNPNSETHFQVGGIVQTGHPWKYGGPRWQQTGSKIPDKYVYSLYK